MPCFLEKGEAMEREKFSSRLGFVLISAGCAIGLGNVWRFPYITGKYGGAAFVLIYFLFLAIMGIPIVVMEFSVGRASQKSIAKSFEVLESKGTKWHIAKYFAIAGNYLLMMFYTTVAGWVLLYVVKMLRGDFVGNSAEQIKGQFNDLMANYPIMIICMVIVVVVGFTICAKGLVAGVEKITKPMMLCLFLLMIVLVINSVTMEGGGAGLEFYLKPDFGKILEYGLGEVVFAAMGQAFFTLSIGIGALAIFGSFIDKERKLLGEAISVTLLDTAVAIMAGFIIFPACFAYGVKPDEGPSLLFITLPNVFNHMSGGRIWGTLFFIFMSFAALSTVIAVFQNIMSYSVEVTGCSLKKAAVINGIAIIILSLPCVLGFSLLSGIQPLGADSTIMDLEDFIVSNNLLPLGSIFYLLFCTTRYGWGFDNFIKEANTGKGIPFPKCMRIYVSYILPLMIFAIFIQGYVTR